MLFWLINITWEILGVSRSASLIPTYLISASILFLTQKFSQKLLPRNKNAHALTPWLILGALPFLVYGTIIMFDLLVAAALLCVLIAFYDYAQKPKISRLLLGGFLLGLGVLSKGPVMYLYALWPLLLYPYWRSESFVTKKKFYCAIGIATLISFIPVLCWLVPTLLQTNGDFAFWLIWNQTAGRVSGNFSASHVRPVYFYLGIAPILFLPWGFMPSFWRSVKQHRNPKEFSFLLCATLPVFACFSLIAGKQPHYLLPLLPFVVIGISIILSHYPLKRIKHIAIGMVILFCSGQIIASHSLLKRYDLLPIAQFYQDHNKADWAISPSYQGEIGFLSRMEKPITVLEKNKVQNWFADHPQSFAVIRYNQPDEISQYTQLYSHPYRGKWIGIFKEKETEEKQ